MSTKQLHSPMRVFHREATARKMSRNKQHAEFPLRMVLIGVGTAITVASAVGAILVVIRNARAQVVITEEMLAEEFVAPEEAVLAGASSKR